MLRWCLIPWSVEPFASVVDGASGLDCINPITESRLN